MTAQNQAQAQAAKIADVSVTGKEVSMISKEEIGFGSAHVAGIVGGLAAAAASYGEGASLTSALVGAVVGGASGYAAGAVCQTSAEASVTAKLIGGGSAALMGLLMGSIACGLADSIGKIGNRGGETASE